MAVYNNHKTVYVEITKNASTSIRRVLEGNDNAMTDHPTYKMLYDMEIANGNTAIDTYFKFITVRNPYDRFCSAYEYMQKQHVMNWMKTFDQHIEFLMDRYARANGQPITVVDSNGNVLPEKAVRALDGQLQYWWDDAPLFCWPQHAFVEVNGVSQVPNWYKVEEIDTAWPTIRAMILQKNPAANLPETLPVHNDQANRLPWQSYFTGENGQQRLDAINDLYAKDFQVYNYNMYGTVGDIPAAE